MYKKIKNGSFMNWIWFIVCILPLCFILFSLNNEDNKTRIYNNLTTYYDKNEVVNSFYIDYDNGVATYEYFNDYTNYIYEFRTIIEEKEDGYEYKFVLNLSPNENKNLYFYSKMELYSDINEDEAFEKITDISKYQLQVTDGTNEFVNIVDETKEYFLFKFSNNVGSYIGNDYLLTFSLRIIDEWDELSKIRFYFYTLDENIDINYFVDEPSQVIIQPLNYWFNNFKSNGFISNAFLNLATLFGVNNVYYALSCYYIEYLLVIVLLHLAFDVLYMLPNICHKFMEKIGGERD